ncbi:MAG: hypothetical protein RKO66_10030 [Candidatus Contendobacter sp.]|nr:hypothetical protein [Candidatus Contendobacter sp.]MDS4058993.1 hypothetical protein [Candidatus Contendobacter sp.]
MKEKTTPFWVEGMSVEERDARVSSLFVWLEQKLGTIHKTNDIPAERAFVFVPDPPPLTFESQTLGFEIRRVSWGVAGRAAATESAQVAAALAPVMFDLWPDSLYVLAFEAELPDDTMLGRWLGDVLRFEFDAVPSDKTPVTQLPSYALMVFDWGDLVGEPSTEK